MGKQKGERSKNRPSSSSLAASLLPSGAVSVGFGGYLGSSKIEQPSSSEDSVPFVEVDNEVAQHMKRLGRKDPTTKIKALASLCVLFGKKPGDEIVQLIPQWAFEYKRLLLDYNREVRRSTHEAMTSLVSNVRKGLVPHLKTLMGPWWFSQFDPIFEVSQAAKKSMEAAFPAPERRLDALMLCVNDIFIYLDENLKLTPQSMSDKATPMDELEDMHHRVISSSLLAVAILLDVLLGPRNLESESVSSEQKLASKARIATISCAEKLFITHNYFLDLFKSKSSTIRSATYSVLTSFIKQLPHTFSDENMKSISGMILGVFQEKDASCHSAMWDMILMFVSKFQNCWSYVNFQKIVVNRFWTFLRHGCYGSQQISYPALVLFLGSIPPNVTEGEQFALDFFENMWIGRSPLISGGESSGFFKAFKECFLWMLSNASRYSNSGDALNPLSIKLINNILVTLVWHDYLFSVNLKIKDGPLEDKLQKPLEKHSYCYSSSYVEELGKCIVGILVDLSNKELDLLSVFSKSFQKDSLEIFQKEEFKLNFQEHMERLSKFCHLLDESAWQIGQKWPFLYFAGPLFVKCFKVIITMNSPYAVKFLCTLFEIFGPVTLLPCLHFCNEDQLNISFDDISNETIEMYFMQAFRDDFVPLCLARRSPSGTSSSIEKLELLIYSIQGHFLSDQWSYILTCIIDPHNYASIDTEVLNVLIGKVKEKIRKMDKGGNHTTGYLPEHWQHQLLDTAATLVATHAYSSTHSAQFLCSVLGGAHESDKTCFLSQAAVVKTFEEIFRQLVSFISTSPLKWAKLSSSLLLSSAAIGEMQNENLTTSDVLKRARFAFEVLEGSIFRIDMLGEDSALLSCTLAAILTIYLEYIMSSSINEEIEEESEEKLALGRRVQSLFDNKDTLIWKNLSSRNLSTLRNVLVHTLRHAIFETSNLSSDKISSLCCEWVLLLLEVTCYDQAELQIYLDQFLSEQNSWSFWVLPPKSVESEAATILKEKEHEAIEILRHDQFVAFVDKLITKLGFPEVITGVISSTGHTKDASPSYSRAWLAAELLCTWKWQGGNALDSFLPSLSKYVTCDSSHPKGHVIFTVVGILLDGIFVNGVKSMWISLDTCIASEKEIDNIKEPFLRALISLLWTLYVKFEAWRKPEAIEIFKNVADRLFIDGNVNKTCLRIFPYVMSVLVEPLLLQSSEFDETSKDVVLAHWKDDFVIENILKWLETALLFPPVGAGYDEESDLGEWVQVISSCYPLKTTHMLGISKVDTVRDISHLENSLLLRLFQNQRSGYNASVAPLSAQMILSKLTVVSVGYCWKYFSEDDWHFVLDNMQNWIELSVLMVEEMVEKIDEMALSSSSNSNQADFIGKLDLAVKALDPSKINISSNALLILSLCSQLFDLQEVDSIGILQSIKHEKWSEIKDRVLENVLRLFFATGVSEAIASSFGSEASLIVASNRVAYYQFWARVSSFVISAPNTVKATSVQSMELWGLSKGPTSSVYAILFSSKPIVSLQNAAYRLISSEPLCQISLLKENYLVEDVNIIADAVQNKFEISSSDSISIMDEISYLIQMPASDLLELDLVSLDRANVYLAWAILLSYLQSLPPSSLAREALIQFVQESIGSSILDCIFQNIPLKQLSVSSKKKDVLCPEAHIAANAAKNIIDSGTTVLDLGTLFPVGNEQMASFAGSIYGMMIWLLPSYVRNWFTSIRDRGLSLSIESFTKAWCSPSLVSFELSQVKETVVADENFSVSVNKSAYELVATYKKEETGMDLVISLPNCYPLRPVDVDCTRSLGISEVKKRKWLLSLTAFVRNQNGAIGEAIRTWKNNLDKEFLGVEECPICYSIIHTANHSLPRLACKTCKHKFHSVCLYKWFSTSHKSTCPLCQMPF